MPADRQEARSAATTEVERLRKALASLGVTEEFDIDRLASGLRPGTVGWLMAKLDKEASRV